jgi:hypothetical protein
MSPVTLVGTGRTGSSLLSAVFAAHPVFESLGETANLIFGAWSAVELTPSTRDAAEPERGRSWSDDDERIGQIVRDFVLHSFPDRGKTRWFHKPIGIPMTGAIQFAGDDLDGLASWYWRVLRSTFPGARFVVMLRHPLDVVRSTRDFFAQPEATAWDSLARMAGILTHEAAPPLEGIAFDALVCDPEATLRRFFDRIEVEFEPAVLGAFERAHVPSRPGSMPERLRARGAEWADLDATKVRAEDLAAVERLFARFGLDFEVPDRFRVGAPSEEEEPARLAPDAAAQIHELQLKLLQTQWKQDAFYTKQIDQLKAHIQELVRGRDWNAAQAATWQAEAGRQAAAVAQLRAYIEDLLRGKAWLEQKLCEALGVDSLE